MEHPDINYPDFIDRDTPCFMMLTRDLPALFGIMARQANRKVLVRDHSEFDDWLHVIFDPIVVNVYDKSDEHERTAFKDNLVNTLRRAFGMTLTCSPSSLTLSRNQVNVTIPVMSDVLHFLGARVCRVSFFGMKCEIPNAESMIDRFIQQYRAEMCSSVPTKKNMFDYWVQFPMVDCSFTNLMKCNAKRGGSGRALCTRCATCQAMGLWTLDQSLTHI